ncbi:hypothetical protein [Pseudolysinimonas sp.]|jgi:hypothetical protein|uniref:hypothetical protein n=1 Tax=Pseudolysinimonas sp. TaxID=2680009 RepID=UPI0037852A74
MALSLDIAANTRDAQAGIKDVAGALDQVADALDDAARDGDQSTERLEGSFRDLARAAERDGNKAGQNLADGLDRGATKASASMREVKAEALSNASETFSSFDGSVSSFVDGVQGTFGGLVAGLAQVNPALVPVAVAAAATIGTIAAAITGAEEDSEEFRAKVAELTSEFIDTGAIAGRAFSGIADEVRGLATETDDSKANLERLSGLAADLESNFEDVVNAYAGGGEPLDDLIDKTEALAAAERIRALELQGNNEFASTEASNRAADLEHELGLLRAQRDAISEATQMQELYYSSGVSEIEGKVALIKAVNTAYDEAAGSTQGFIDAETGLFDVSAYLAAMQERETALRDYQATLATAGLSAEAKAFLNEQGVEAAATMLAGYQSASTSQRAELDRFWSEAGKQNSGTYVTEIGAALGASTVPAPRVTFNPSADAAAYHSTAQEYFRRNPVNIRAKLFTRYGQEVL